MEVPSLFCRVGALGRAEHYLCLARCKIMGSCLLNTWSKILLFPAVPPAPRLHGAGVCVSTWVVHAPSPCSRIPSSVYCRQVPTAVHWFVFRVAKPDSIWVFSDLSSGSLGLIPEPSALQQELPSKSGSGIHLVCLLPNLCATH